MRVSVAWKRFFVGVSIAFASAPSWSQVAYLCASEGRAYYSVQPCPSPPSPVRSVGPTREVRLSAPTAPRATPDKPGEHLHYQSPRCAEMSEGLRTGASRGLGSGAQQELRDSYRRLCIEDESRAREQAKDERTRQRDLREQEARAARIEQDRDKLTREQCDEMVRIAQAKRQRLESMTAGERTDFERFEATRKARCGR